MQKQPITIRFMPAIAQPAPHTDCNKKSLKILNFLLAISEISSHTESIGAKAEKTGLV